MCQVLVHSDHCARKLLPWFDGFDLSFCPIFLDSFGCIVGAFLTTAQGDLDWRCILFFETRNEACACDLRHVGG